jgi:DNA-binding transcriptional LysR family regulator
MFLAVAEHHSLRAAAAERGVTQPTVARHVRALEQALGVPLFERGRNGHDLTEAGAGLLPRALEMRAAARSLSNEGEQLRDTSSHLVHVAANDWPAMLLARHAPELVMEKGVRLEISGKASADILTSREADIAIWHGLPKSGDYLTRKIGTLDCAIYASHALALVARDMEEDDRFERLPWILFNESQAHFETMQWLARHLGDRPSLLRFDRTELILQAVASGAGLAILPCAIAASDPRLVRIGPKIDALKADYWLISHRDGAKTPWMRSAINLLVDVFAKAADSGQIAADRLEC